MAENLDQLIGYLNNLTVRPGAADLAARLAELPLESCDFSPYRRFSERKYTRNLIADGTLYNLWLLCWRSGQRSPIHDHRESSCAVRIVSGVATETLFETAPNGFIKPVQSCDHQCGQTTHSADLDVHQISNLQAGDAELVTLHVYSPPLKFMGTYSLENAERALEPMALEFRDAAGI